MLTGISDRIERSAAHKHGNKPNVLLLVKGVKFLPIIEASRISESPRFIAEIVDIDKHKKLIILWNKGVENESSKKRLFYLAKPGLELSKVEFLNKTIDSTKFKQKDILENELEAIKSRIKELEDEEQKSNKKNEVLKERISGASKIPQVGFEPTLCYGHP